MPTAWEAVYNDGSTLKQFNDDGSENSFGDINQDELFEFRLFHDGRVLSLFLPTGTFGLNGFLYNTDVSNLDVNYRLIHFARRQKSLGPRGGDKSKYFVGFQITKEGRNQQRMIEVSEKEVRFVSK